MNTSIRSLKDFYDTRQRLQLLNSMFDAFAKGDNMRMGYAVYCALCKQRGVKPVDFRTWARIDFEYDLEWEAANHEYDHSDY